MLESCSKQQVGLTYNTEVQQNLIEPRCSHDILLSCQSDLSCGKFVQLLAELQPTLTG